MYQQIGYKSTNMYQLKRITKIYKITLFRPGFVRARGLVGVTQVGCVGCSGFVGPKRPCRAN